MASNNITSFLNEALTNSQEAKSLLAKRKFFDSFEKSYLSIYSTAKAVANENTGIITPIDYLNQLDSMVEQEKLDVVFYDALFKAIAMGEKSAEFHDSINQKDAEEIFDFSIQVLKKAREIYDAQKG